MPPQPILRVRRNATANIDPSALRRHPDLAVCIADIVAIWARIDSDLGSALAFMLNGAIRPAVAMYGALTSAQAQMAALEAAARECLSPENLDLFGAVIVLVKQAGAKRNKIVHWLWGDSPDIPHALVLFDPISNMEFNTALSELVSTGETAGTAFPTLNLAHAFVYKARDFDEIIKELHIVEHITRRFSASLVHGGAHGTSASLRRQLLALPRIQKALRQIQK
jgi:hypothetical protein